MDDDEEFEWLSIRDDLLPVVGLMPEELMAEAEETTGLSDWGSVPFRGPFELYMKAVQETGNLSNRGRILIRGDVMRLLCNRLRIERVIQKNPSILETPIPRPLFITGLPRTGSTLLHRLLSCDPQARYIRLCEGLYPMPPPDPATFKNDSRIGKTEKGLQLRQRLCENSDQKHLLAPLEAEECNFLFEHSFADFYFTNKADVPEYEKWLHASERNYDDFRRIAQILGWKWRPGVQHWVFKSPHHLPGLRSLLKVFPDARIVWTHRDPVEVVPSTCSLLVQERSIYAKGKINAERYGPPVLEKMRDMLDIGLNVREEDEREHAKRYIDVDYKELMADPIHAVRKIYQFFEYPFTSEFETAMREWLKENPRNKHGNHKYSAEEFGLQNIQINHSFARYRMRFDPYF